VATVRTSRSSSRIPLRVDDRSKRFALDRLRIAAHGSRTRHLTFEQNPSRTFGYNPGTEVELKVPDLESTIGQEGPCSPTDTTRIRVLGSHAYAKLINRSPTTHVHTFNQPPRPLRSSTSSQSACIHLYGKTIHRDRGRLREKKATLFSFLFHWIDWLYKILFEFTHVITSNTISLSAFDFRRHILLHPVFSYTPVHSFGTIPSFRSIYASMTSILFFVLRCTFFF